MLLGQFRTKSLSRDWVVAELEVSKHDDSEFRRDISTRLRSALLELSPKVRWTDRFHHAAAVLKSFTISADAVGTWTAGLDVEAAEGFADHANLAQDLTDVFLALGEAAVERRRGVVLLSDEVQFLSKPQLESLIEALNKMVQRKVPIIMVGAGLPQIAELAGDAKSHAERRFTFPAITNLSPADAQTALARPAGDEGASFTDDALAEAVTITGGYPSFVQEVGYAVWSVADGPLITKADVEAAIPACEAKLDASFFRVRLDRATELQRPYLRAMAELGPTAQKATDVADVMGRTSTNLGPTRAELINMGLLYTPEHGYAAFTVPYFDRFLLRAIPTLNVPPLRLRNPTEAED